MKLAAAILALAILLSPLFAAVGWSSSATSAVVGKPLILSGKAIFTTHDGKLYCFSQGMGTLEWIYDVGGKIILPAAAFDGTFVAAATTGGKLIVVNANTGRLVCESAAGKLATGLAAAGGRAFLGTDDSIAAFDPGCQRLWLASIASQPGQIGTDDKNLYFTSGGKLYSLSQSSGTTNWMAQTGDSFLSTPVEKDGLVFIGSTDGNLYAIRRQGGFEAWRYPTGGWVAGTPLAFADNVYVASNDGHLYALTRTGELVFKAEAGGGSWSKPVAYSANGKDFLVFATNDGNVEAVYANDGAAAWSFSPYGTPRGMALGSGAILFGTDAGRIYSLSSSPICSLTWPKQGMAFGPWQVDVEGNANGDGGITLVEVRTGGGQWSPAGGKEAWRASVDLSPHPYGEVKVECRATDASGKVETGEYSVLSIIKSENAPRQRMFISLPKQAKLGEEIVLSVKDERGNDARGIKAVLGGEEKGGDSPLSFKMDSEGRKRLLIEKSGFENIHGEIEVQGEGPGLLPIAGVAILAIGAYFLFIRKKK